MPKPAPRTDMRRTSTHAQKASPRGRAETARARPRCQRRAKLRVQPYPRHPARHTLQRPAAYRRKHSQSWSIMHPKPACLLCHVQNRRRYIIHDFNLQFPRFTFFLIQYYFIRKAPVYGCRHTPGIGGYLRYAANRSHGCAIQPCAINFRNASADAQTASPFHHKRELTHVKTRRKRQTGRRDP